MLEKFFSQAYDRVCGAYILGTGINAPQYRVAAPDAFLVIDFVKGIYRPFIP